MKLLNNIIIAILIVSSIIACKHKIKDSVSENDIKLITDDPLEVSRLEKGKWENLIVKEGNVNAYIYLYDYHMMNGTPLEIEQYAKVMAEEYDYGDAYYDLYFCLICNNNGDFAPEREFDLLTLEDDKKK